MLDKLLRFLCPEPPAKPITGKPTNIPAGVDPLPYLNQLRRLDTRYEIFGATKHGYKSTRVRESKLEELEAKLRIHFPDEYRKHLTQFGHGAGPYYGLEDPEASISHMYWDIEWLKREEGKSISPSEAFFLTSSDPFKAETFLDPEKQVPMFAGSWPSNGCLQIADQGCQGSSVLILAGEFRGCVFDMEYDGGDSAFWFPARRPPGRVVYGESHRRVRLDPLNQPPTFDDWYIGWLARSLSDLSVAQ